MEVQILDIDYVNVNSRPVIRIFGRDSDNRSVVVFYEGYLPYFYANECNEQEIIGEAGVLKVEKVKKSVIGRGEREIYKITLNNPQLVVGLRDRLREKGIEVYEADILFKSRFMADFGLAGLGWIKVVDAMGVNTESVRADYTVTAGGISPISKERNAQLKMMALDIECVSASGGMPESNKDPVVMISLVLSHEYKGAKNMVLGLRTGEGVLNYDDEKGLLEEFIRIVGEYDPDVLTGFNINGFDMPYVLDRMAANGIKPAFGRCRSKPAFNKKFGTKKASTVAGRVVVDSYALVKKDFSLQRYGLDFVAERLLKEKKDDVKKSEIPKYYKGTDAMYKQLVAYCLQDSVLAMNLVVKLQLLDKYMALARVSGTLLQDALDGGEATRIENYLLREFNHEGIVFPSRPDDNGATLAGGEVLEPAKGLHSSVAVLDFRSMYPSIIRSFNICPTTLTKDVNNSVETVNGARFLKREVRVGVIPRIVEHLMNARQETKKAMKDEKDDELKRILHGKQWAYKILANAFYGYLGYARSKLFDLQIANAITATGRKIIIDTKDAVEKRFGLKVVYGDTDSIFVKMDCEDFDGIEKRAIEIVKFANTILPSGIELEFEKIFKRFLPLSKKRYAAWCFTKSHEGWKGKIESKGIETVRRDWCPLVGKSIQKILEIILIESDQKKALEYFKEISKNLLSGKIPMDELIVTKTMTREVANYAGMQPHIELVKKIKARSPEEAPGIGDRIGFVIVKGTQLMSKRAEDPRYVAENSMQVDSQYYIENQLMPPLERIFFALGVSKNELLGNGKQMGLFDTLRANGNVKPKVLESIGMENVTGYCCEKCSEFYAFVTLTGSCRCGGSLLFSSAQGPARFAVA